MATMKTGDLEVARTGVSKHALHQLELDEPGVLVVELYQRDVLKPAASVDGPGPEVSCRPHPSASGDAYRS